MENRNLVNQQLTLTIKLIRYYIIYQRLKLIKFALENRHQQAKRSILFITCHLSTFCFHWMVETASTTFHSALWRRISWFLVLALDSQH